MTTKWKSRLGFLLIAGGLTLCCVGVRNLLSPAQYLAEVKIKAADFPNRIQSPIESINSPAYDPHFLQSQFEVIKSDLILSRVVEAPLLKVKWHNSHGGTSLDAAEAIALIRKRLALRPVRNTKLFSVRFTSANPAEAAAVANAIADAYADYVREQVEKARIGHMTELQRQLREAEEKVNVAGNEVRGFIPTDVEAQGTFETPEAFTNGMHRLEVLATEIESKAVEKEELLTRLNNLTGEEQYRALMTGLDDSGLAEVLTQRGEFESVVTRLQRNTNSLSAELFLASNRLAIVQQRVEERARGLLKGLSNDVTHYRNGVIELRSVVRKAHKQREAGNARVLRYREAKEKLHQAQQELKNVQSNVQAIDMETRWRLDHNIAIKDRADVPQNPFGPNRRLGAALLTLGLASVAIGLRLMRSAKNAE